jgi:type IV pilus assembly protein PilX
MINMSSSLRPQRGVVLIIGLIMLLLLTVIGLAAMRGTGLQEQMAGNMRDHNLAFQAAEAALRAGEEVLNGVSLPSFSGAVVGYYPDLNQPAAIHPRPASWSASNWNSWSVQLADNTISQIAANQQPRYVIERLTVPASSSNQGSCIDFECKAKIPDPIYYRITSRGIGGTTDSEVILQSTFADKN